MSETAKERVLTVGARFTSLEHTNQLKPTVSEEQRKGTTQPQTTKVAFWKKGTGASKVPGRAVYGAQHPPLHITDGALLESISKNAKARNKKQLSYQEFEGSTVDAWEDDEDEIIKLSQSPSHESYEAPVAKPQESSPARSSSTRKIDSPSHRFKEESGDRGSVGSATTKSRQPKASARNENKPLKNSIKVKQAIVSKLSETIGENVNCFGVAKATKNRFSPPPSASPEPAEIMQPPTPHSPIRQVKAELQDQESARLERFGKLLAGPTTDMDQLQKLSWNGIPNSVRPSTWRLLSGYLPPSIDRRQSTLERKRQEYSNFVAQYYPTRFDELNQETYRQISIDIPRTNPLIPIFQQRVVQEIFERVLYIWAIRHPASGYVQGINDLVVPFFITFLSEHLDEEVETYDINRVPKGILDSVEADTFWCVTKLLNGIQDNYTFAQPGIQHKINALSDLVSRIDGPLHKHIREYNIDYLQFAFRWMNNLLMRELSLRCLIRLWDTYWAEPDGFAIFHLYVCAALLTRFSKEISHMFDFQTIMRFLQDLPTRSWTEEDIAVIVAEAYRLKFVFGDAPKHLKSSSSLR